MKDKLLEFYISKFEYLDCFEKVDLDFIPVMLRRRLSLLDKTVLSVLNKTYTQEVQNIVFSSQYGESDRLIKIINQYVENNEVSPNTFSGSVHNYAVGFFLMNKQKPISYNAISSCENSLSIGLLSSVISDYDRTLFCYADIDAVQVKALAINLSKNQLKDSKKYRININNNNELPKDNFTQYLELFSGRQEILETFGYTISRVK